MIIIYYYNYIITSESMACYIKYLASYFKSNIHILQLNSYNEAYRDSDNKNSSSSTKDTVADCSSEEEEALNFPLLVNFLSHGIFNAKSRSLVIRGKEQTLSWEIFFPVFPDVSKEKQCDLDNQQ